MRGRALRATRMPTTTSTFLNVHDIEKSLAFYKALGFKVNSVTKDEGKIAYADLSLRGAELGLGSISSNDDPEYVKWISSPLGAGVLIYFTTPGVDAIYAAAKKAGAVIEYPPTDRSYGRVFSLNDPDGYTLSFLTEPRPSRPAKKKAKAAKPKKAKKAAPKRR